MSNIIKHLPIYTNIIQYPNIYTREARTSARALPHPHHPSPHDFTGTYGFTGTYDFKKGAIARAQEGINSKGNKIVLFIPTEYIK